ncbi:MAG: M20 family metallopeptidase [Chloroflexota bacterium]
MDTEKLKASVIADVDERRQQLSELSLKIHSHPELAFKESQAAAWLSQFLQDNGFSVERGICGLPTAFRGSYGRGEPVIAILAEYDALPGLGHACGHNIIAVSAVAAGVAARRAVDSLGGRVLVIGTPGEELYGGKVIMGEQGAFDGVDAAMIAHPGEMSAAAIQALACQTLDVEFFGRASHAAASPEAGINALDAMLLSFAAISALRQHIRSTARIHGIITDGGQAANIVPAHSTGNFIVRAREDDYLEELKERVLNCFAGAATASGARLEYRWGGLRYASMVNNMTMARLFRQNMRELGRSMHLSDESGSFGSTDMGNVSHLVPSIHPMVAIVPPKSASIHSPQFAQAAASEEGTRGLVDAAKALAMTAVDLLSSTELLGRVEDEFRHKKDK